MCLSAPVMSELCGADISWGYETRQSLTQAIPTSQTVTTARDTRARAAVIREDLEARRDPGGCGRARVSPVLESLSCAPQEKQMMEPMVSVPHSSQVMVF